MMHHVWCIQKKGSSIDLSKGKAKAEKVPAEWMLKYLGGRGWDLNGFVTKETQKRLDIT